MTITKIRKRNGEFVDFDPKHILIAIQKATDATIERLDRPFEISDDFVSNLSENVINELEEIFIDLDRLPTVEEIQDVVERQLVESGNFDIAKSYILYRAEHANIRTQERIEKLSKIEQNLLKVRKANGKLVLFSKDKLKKVFDKAAIGYKKECKFKDVYSILKDRLVDCMDTEHLMDILVKACIDLITVKNIAWQNIAGMDRNKAILIYISCGNS